MSVVTYRLIKGAGTRVSPKLLLEPPQLSRNSMLRVVRAYERRINYSKPMKNRAKQNMIETEELKTKDI